jgi:outer membrane biosynthesis protein TonB
MQLLPLRLKNSFATTAQRSAAAAATTTRATSAKAKTATKKPKTKAKTAVKKPKTTKAKKVIKAKKKPVAKPKKKAVRKRKELTPEQEVDEKRKALKRRIAALKVAALTPPKPLPTSARTLYFSRNFTGNAMAELHAQFDRLSDVDKAVRISPQRPLSRLGFMSLWILYSNSGV